jgi:hypothetical protein
MDFTITAFWDSDAKVWVANNDELGLVAESESLDTLESKIRALIPDLVELNGIVPDSDPMPWDLLIHDRQRRCVRA